MVLQVDGKYKLRKFDQSKIERFIRKKHIDTSNWTAAEVASTFICQIQKLWKGYKAQSGTVFPELVDLTLWLVLHKSKIRRADIKKKCLVLSLLPTTQGFWWREWIWYADLSCNCSHLLESYILIFDQIITRMEGITPVEQANKNCFKKQSSYKKSWF